MKGRRGKAAEFTPALSRLPFFKMDSTTKRTSLFFLLMCLGNNDLRLPGKSLSRCPQGPAAVYSCGRRP